MGAKEIAAQEGMSLTFMAKYDEREGNSCHIHLSLRSADDEPVLAGDGANGFSPLMEHFLAGQLACLEELTLLLAPNVNSYKRFVPGQLRPDRGGVGPGQPHVRAPGRRATGLSLRAENRVPGGDVNPYLALAALIAAGLHGIDERAAARARAHRQRLRRRQAPRADHAARRGEPPSPASDVAKAAFGQDVVDHYCNAARVELDAFDAAVTDWERIRGFERL